LQRAGEESPASELGAAIVTAMPSKATEFRDTPRDHHSKSAAWKIGPSVHAKR
jgi:hypothetical protein